MSANLNLTSAIFQYGYRRGIFKFVVNLKSAIFQYGYRRGIFVFVVTLKSAIFQYGYRHGIFKFVVIYVRHFSNMATYAVLSKLC